MKFIMTVIVFVTFFGMFGCFQRDNGIRVTIQLPDGFSGFVAFHFQDRLGEDVKSGSSFLELNVPVGKRLVGVKTKNPLSGRALIVEARHSDGKIVQAGSPSQDATTMELLRETSDGVLIFYYGKAAIGRSVLATAGGNALHTEAGLIELSRQAALLEKQ